MEATSTRTPQEVFQHHAEVLVAGDIDGIVSDYADDAIFITPSGILRGRDGVRKGFEGLLGDLPNAEWEVPTTLFEDEQLRHDVVRGGVIDLHAAEDDALLEQLVVRVGLLDAVAGVLEEGGQHVPRLRKTKFTHDRAPSVFCEAQTG